MSFWFRPQPSVQEQEDVWSKWRELCRIRDEQFVADIIQKAESARDALYVDPYNEAVSLYREYGLGVPA